MKNIKIYILFFLLLLGSSCELDLLDNPNSLSEDSADVDYLLNSVQLSFKDFFHDASSFGMDNTRMTNMGGSTYESAYSPSSFDGIWSNAYATFLADVKALIPMAEESELFYHSGIARIMEAYVLITMVDYFGDIPYSQALDKTNFNPETDHAADVYAAAQTLLDAGIADLGKTSRGTPATDLYYDDADQWIRFANSVKLKVYIQSRLVNANAKAQIEALIADADALIDDSADDFQFQYGTNNSSPDSRHPDFAGNYVNGASKYMANYFMYVLYKEKSVVDPRMNYYFYRQTLDISSNPIELPCAGASKPTHYPANVPYCSVGDGYWGRDHLDDDGIPPDNKLRTIWGVYPAAGKYDDGTAAAVTQDSGGKGAGIEPIMTSSFVKFMLAEAAITLGADGLDARVLLEQAVRESITKVLSFGSLDPKYTSHTGTSANDYIAVVLANYDAAASDTDRLNVVLKEYYIALFGNGVEAYNTYRRTGLPKGFQPALQANPGKFYRSFIYPANYITRNATAVQKTSPSVQVFWDTNPADFIN